MTRQLTWNWLTASSHSTPHSWYTKPPDVRRISPIFSMSSLPAALLSCPTSRLSTSIIYPTTVWLLPTWLCAYQGRSLRIQVVMIVFTAQVCTQWPLFKYSWRTAKSTLVPWPPADPAGLEGRRPPKVNIVLHFGANQRQLCDALSSPILNSKIMMSPIINAEQTRSHSPSVVYQSHIFQNN